VFYVWYDALTSYMSGIGYANDDPARRARFDHFWPADVHMIGKEIIRFHAVYWPAFLMAAELPLPKRIHAHGWLLFEQEKMSKSKGNVAYPEPIVKVLGNDALRYYLLRETVFGQDGNFSREALITRYNADLANGLGNLASRTLTMIARYLGGQIPWFDSGVILTRPPHRSEASGSGDAPVSGMLYESFDDETLAGIVKLYEKFEFSRAVEKIWALVATCDRYLASDKPWTYAEDSTQRRRLERTMFTAAEALRVISVLAHPVIPEATERIWKQLGNSAPLERQRIDQVGWGTIQQESRVGKLEGVFPRVDKKEAMERIEAMEQEIRNPGSAQPAAAGTAASSGVAAPAAAQAASAAAAPAEVPGVVKIGIEDFAKVEMRVGLVKSAEKVAGADKLLKLMVDLGDEVRQIVAGIATAYQPEELLGRKVVVVANLAPRRLRGVESNGMLLAASTAEGKPVLCTFAEDVPLGARLK
jgi:methionyl-tRNA synthetase